MSKVKAALKEQGVNEDNLKESIKQVRDNFMGRKQEIEDEVFLQIYFLINFLIHS